MTIAQKFPTDHNIKETVLAELEWTPSIQADHIGVAINDGAVTLSGQVQTYPEKHAAVAAAFRVRGVTAVADEIEVHNSWTPRNDTDVAREAGEFLKRTPMAAAGSVQAEVHHHIVTLTGSVAWNYEREAIGHAIGQLPGVHGVSNIVTLKPTVHVSPTVAKTKIADALRRNASVEAQHITVDVAGDHVTLSGSVATWSERAAADHAAWATPGVTHVENDLRVTH